MKDKLDNIEDEIKKKLELRNTVKNAEIRPLAISGDTEIRPLDVKLEPLEVELRPLDTDLEPFEELDTSNLFEDLEFTGFKDLELEPFKDLEFNGFEDIDTSNLFEDLEPIEDIFKDLELRPIDELLLELDNHLTFTSEEERAGVLARLETKIKELVEERDKLLKKEAEAGDEN